jgi:hypothetical protein
MDTKNSECEPHKTSKNIGANATGKSRNEGIITWSNEVVDYFKALSQLFDGHDVKLQVNTGRNNSHTHSHTKKVFPCPYNYF